MGLSAPEQADAYARAEFDVPSAPEADDYARTPSHQANNIPLDLLAPIRKKNSGDGSERSAGRRL